MAKRTKARDEMMAECIFVLVAGYGLDHCGTLRGCPIFADKWPHAAYYYSVSDNGGEIHVHRINSSSPGESTAYETIDGRMNGATMAYRVQCVMRKEKIDYAMRLTNEDVQILKQAA